MEKSSFVAKGKEISYGHGISGILLCQALLVVPSLSPALGFGQVSLHVGSTLCELACNFWLVSERVLPARAGVDRPSVLALVRLHLSAVFTTGSGSAWRRGGSGETSSLSTAA